MGSDTPIVDAATYICDEGSVLRVCDGLTEVVPAGLARRLESALKVAEAALRPVAVDGAISAKIIADCREALRAIEQIKGGV